MKRNIACLFLAGLILLVAGCLDSKKYSDLVYDEKTDTFRMLRVYYHINGGTVAERDYLASLYLNRENLLPTEFVSLMTIFGENAYLRMDAKTYYSIGLGQAGPKPPAPGSAVVDLSKIVNKPGKFFEAGENSLGYYHQIEIPGATLDEWIAWANGDLRTKMGKVITDELTRRAAGGKVGTWDDLRDEIIKKMADNGPGNAPNNGQADPNETDKGEMPFNILSADSLKLIQKAIEDKQIGLARKGSVFTLAMPATAEDRKGFMATRDAIKNELRKKLEAEDKEQKLKVVLDVIDTISIENDEKGGQIVTTADYVKVRKAMETAPGFFEINQKPDPAKAKQMAATLAAMKDAGIEVDDKIKLADIPGMFVKGTLPVDRPKKEVKAGEGLFKEGGAKPE